MTRMEIAMRFVLCLLVVGFLSACGGGGGSSIAMMPSSGGNDEPPPIRFPSVISSSSSLFSGDVELSQAAVAEIQDRPPVVNEDSLSFYDQLLSRNGVAANGHAGDYTVYSHVRSSEELDTLSEESGVEYLSFTQALFVYSHIIAMWTSDTADANRSLDAYTVQGLYGIFSLDPTNGLPARGQASYNLQGYGWLRHDPFGTSLEENIETRYITMTGQIDADFDANTVGGHLSSNYGYAAETIEAVRGRSRNIISPLSRQTTRDKFFGEGVAVSDLSGEVRLDFAGGRFLMENEEFQTNIGNTALRLSEDYCLADTCFAADLDVGMATGNFASLSGNQVAGYAVGSFAGTNREEVGGQAFVQNNFPLDGVPVTQIHATFAGRRQTE